MPEDRTCVTCGEAIPDGSQATRIYCSAKCKRQTTYFHTCGWCGTAFSNHTSRQKFCSRDCAVKARGPRPKPDNAKCGHCGKSFRVFPYRLRTAKTVYCSTECMGYGQVKAGADRKPNIGQLPRRLRREVWERDNYVCQLCGEACDRTVGPHHPLAPTVDHIIPRAVEVINEPWNLQTAHKSCNSSKSDKIGGVSWRVVNSGSNSKPSPPRRSAGFSVSPPSRRT